MAGSFQEGHDGCWPGTIVALGLFGKYGRDARPLRGTVRKPSITPHTTTIIIPHTIATPNSLQKPKQPTPYPFNNQSLHHSNKSNTKNLSLTPHPRSLQSRAPSGGLRIIRLCALHQHVLRCSIALHKKKNQITTNRESTLAFPQQNWVLPSP
jgi:hypothetical protein